MPKKIKKTKSAYGFSSVVLILLVVLVLIALGGGYFYLQSQKTKEGAKIENIENQPRLQIVIPSPLVSQPPADQMIYKTYQSPDGKLSFSYPASWTQIDIKNLETMIPKEMIDKNELSMPLLLTEPTGGRLVLTIYHFNKTMTPDQMMYSMEADSARLGAPYNEISRKTVGDSLVVDSKISAGGITMMNRDILFVVDGSPKKTAYVLSLASPENAWSKFETIFSRVESSAKLSP